MISFEETGGMLDAIAEELPPAFFDELNGGISLLPDIRRVPDDPGLYTLGEYHIDPVLGRYIVIYYGSFTRVYRHLSAEQWREALKKTLLHEFTHHIESLAGERGLEIKDELDRERYRNRD